MTAIAGTFADFKLIKTRSVAQLVVEVPIEEADAALKLLGGVPQPGHEKPVAIARLKIDGEQPANSVPGRAAGGHARAEALTPERRAEIAKQAAETRWRPPKQKWSDMKLAQRAALMCADETSWDVLNNIGSGRWSCANAGEAAELLRLVCNVKSRAEFDTDPAAAERYLAIEKQWLQHKADRERFGP